jgi:acetyl-CoA carboxylase carboxyl transferase subunit alpha
MLANKLIDGIVEEPLGGAHTDPDWMAAKVKGVILSSLQELEGMSPEERIDKRIDKFSRMGVVVE